MRKIYIVHAAIGHISPYMTALKYHLEKWGYSVSYISNIYDPFYREGEDAFVYFHRLGRLYRDMDIGSAALLIDRIREIKNHGLKVIWTIHNFYPLSSSKNEINQFVILELAKLSDYIFTHTNQMMKNAEMLFQRNVVNHGYGTDFDLNGKIEKINKKTNSDDFRFVFLGNIRDYKNIELLIESFKNIKKKYTNVRLELIGPDYNNYMKELLCSIKLTKNDNIYIINKFVENPQSYIGNSDVIVCTYKTMIPQFEYGFFPSSISNLGKYGVPIICPNCESVLDIIGVPENAFLYEDSSQNSLEETMIKVYDSNIIERISVGNKLKEHLDQQKWNSVIQKINDVIMDKR